MKCFVLLLLGLVAMLAGLEGLSFLALQLRPTGNPLAYPAREASLHLYEPSDGWLFYRVKPHHRQRFRLDEFDTQVRTNNVGFREDENFTGRTDIAFVGDSFTFGHGVEAGERYSDRVRQAMPGTVVWSYAYANGYAPPHYLLFLRRHPELVPATLVVGLFPWNDLRHDIADMTVERDDAGEILAIRSRHYRVGARGFLVREGGVESESALHATLREFNLGRIVLLAGHRLSRLAQEAAAVPAGGRPAGMDSAAAQAEPFDAHAQMSLAALVEIDRLVRSKGGRVMILYIPASYVVGRYPYFCETLDGHDGATCERLRHGDAEGAALRAWAAAHCLHFIDPVPAFRAREEAGTRLYLAKDGHWTVAGHAAAAALVLSELARPPDGDCQVPR